MLAVVPIGKLFDVWTDHAPNSYILSLLKLSHRLVRWVEILVEYAAKFIYNPDRIYFAPDALSWISTLNAVGKPLSLLEAMRLDLNTSINKEVLGYISKVYNPTSDFSINLGLIVKLVLDNSPIVIPGDANLSKLTILTKLYTSSLRGYLGYRKLLELIRAWFLWPHHNQQVKIFCRSCVLY